MRVRIQLFARARDLAGAEWIELEFAEAATIGDLRQVLGRRFPALETLVARSAIALDEEFAEDSESIHEQSKLALLPPVSGGTRSCSLARPAQPVPGFTLRE
jgi:molybdopterin converting factor small subunit